MQHSVRIGSVNTQARAQMWAALPAETSVLLDRVPAARRDKVRRKKCTHLSGALSKTQRNTYVSE